MAQELVTINEIQTQKQKDINAKTLPPLDSEGMTLAEGKRFTFDVITTPADPLR